MELAQEFKKVVDKYLKVFEDKNGIKFEYWVGDSVGEIAVCGDFFFNFTDIRYDIDSNQEKNRIFKWYDEQLLANQPMNYGNWCEIFTQQTIEFKDNAKITFDCKWWDTEFLKTLGKQDKVIKPDYYKAGNMDVIAFCQYHNLDFPSGSIIKYLVRAGKKEGNTKLQDLEKAKEYVLRLLLNYK